MIAAVRNSYGSPDVIQLKTLPIPEPGPEQLLIKVGATTVNRTDLGVLTGLPYIFRFFIGWPRPQRAVLGTDFAGVVQAVGPKVTRFGAGDRIWGFRDIGLSSQAEYVCLDETMPMALIPDGIADTDAVAAGEGAHYAFNFIRNLAGLHPGMRVLVNGATGAIGSAAIQLLKYRGVHVTAVCPAGYVQKVFALGADRVIDFESADFTKENQRYHFVLDTVGKSRFKWCRPLLEPGGAYLSSEPGPNLENIWLPLFTRWNSRKNIFPIPSNWQRSIDYMTALLKEGRFRPLIDREYPLQNAADAYRYVAMGQKKGNVILRCNPPESPSA